MKPQENIAPVKLSAKHLPKLTAGRYRLTTRLKDELLVPGRVDGAPDPDAGITPEDRQRFQNDLDFLVDAPRFSLPQSAIQSVWPPNGHSADFSKTLPQIMLNRPSLPWERALTLPGQETSPWLALLCLSETDFQTSDSSGCLPIPKIRAVADLISPGPEAEIVGPKITLPPPEDAATGEAASALCETLDLPLKLFRAVAPAVEDLHFLAHVRHAGADPQCLTDDAARETARSVIVANRFPARPVQLGGTELSRVFLVSLEGLEPHLRDKEAPKQPAADERLIRIAVLHSWSFQSTHSVFFEREIKGLEVLALGDKPDSDAPREGPGAILARAGQLGYCALPHLVRTGEKTLSWYRGPFIPYSLVPPERPALHTTSDSALRYDTQTGLFDLSYAAAFQLGRLMALKDRHFSKSLIAWRDRCRRYDNKRPHPFGARLSGAGPIAEAFISARAHSELQQPDDAAQDIRKEDAFPKDAMMWLAKLSLLRGVPFHYLLPDERMLGQNEMRQFFLDPNWTSSLLSGACSLGRHRASEENTDTYLSGMFSRLPAMAAGLQGNDVANWPFSGFLLRSSLVDAWSDLSVVGYDTRDGHNTRLAPLRIERLAPDILLCLYNGRLDRLEIGQSHMSRHFGGKALLDSTIKDQSQGDEAGETGEEEVAGRVMRVRNYADAQLFETSVGFANEAVEKPLKATINVSSGSEGTAAHD